MILAQAKTAREAVKLLGRIVETQGAGESFGAGFVDKNEAWYFEAGSGHQWLAQRLPKDKYFATGNQGRLQSYDPKNPDFMASKTLVSWAQEHGFYDPPKTAPLTLPRPTSVTMSATSRTTTPRLADSEDAHTVTEAEHHTGDNLPRVCNAERR